MPDIEGTNLNDTITGTISPQWIAGYDGDDIIYGGGGGDYINGGRGDDDLYGEDGDDVFEIGGIASSTDFLHQAGGTQNGWDNFDGGSGYDTIAILPTSGYSWTSIQIDSLTGIEEIDNQSGGPGYVYFRGNIDLSGLVAIKWDRLVYWQQFSRHFQRKQSRGNCIRGSRERYSVWKRRD